MIKRNTAKDLVTRDYKNKDNDDRLHDMMKVSEVNKEGNHASFGVSEVAPESEFDSKQEQYVPEICSQSREDDEFYDAVQSGQKRA
jgi:hypothetical protein